MVVSSAEESVVDAVATCFKGESRAGVGSVSEAKPLALVGDEARLDLEGDTSRLSFVGEPSRDGVFVALELEVRSSLILSCDSVR